MDLTETERKLADEIGFAHDVCAFIKQETGKPLERACGVTDDGDGGRGQYPAHGISVVASNDEIEDFIRANQDRLLRQGYRAFRSEREAEGVFRRNGELIVLKTTDHHAIVELRQPGGGNYSLSPRDILARIREWEQKCRFTIVGASDDWVAMEFETLPADLCAFAEEVYLFCPDSVHQGVWLVEEDEEPGMFAAARQLCPENLESLQAAAAKWNADVEQTFAGESDRRFKDFIVGVARRTLPTGVEMGVSLLAYELQKKYLFLWWD